jgi:hypothetical protein
MDIIEPFFPEKLSFCHPDKLVRTTRLAARSARNHDGWDMGIAVRQQTVSECF